ncbi:UDP-glucose 4-epimerase [Pseudomonas brassicacearum]|uniref:UDP-glucose 4-epimerase n=2 Tax=Pseudomonas brassicacearum TaxID=930166 RepID=A0AAW8M3R7_9PSED|nr:UDP-glucose 4-epimerase [Pseudomonas brassicacearum]
MRDDPRTSLDEYRRVNVVETMKLAYQAVEAKVRRFVFISSIKVNGETTPDGKPFTANDDPCPADPYGISKMEAEKQLQSLAASTGMELVIIRPVLVYGPNVKANFAKLLIWVDKGIPFPFGRVSNKRSFLYLDNLVEFVALCITHRAAANEIFLVSDAEDISVASMVQKIARCLGRRAVLLPIPMKLLRLGACMLGKKDTAVRLLSSLQVDTTKNSVLLGWQPPYSLDDGIEHTVKYYIEAKPR